jgi:hypothetical protein
MIKHLLMVCLTAVIGLGALGVAPSTSAGPNAAVESRFFPETQHWVSGRFLQYWNEHGGLAQQGYPLTEEFVETNKLDGKVYTVQYFERAIFEKHPENAPPYDVLLTQLGTYELNNRYPTGSNPAAQPAGGGTVVIPPYFEDRTSDVGLLQSYYNAINRREFQRAYNYWENHDAAPPNGSGPYQPFAQGFADTASVALTLGKPVTQGAAGSIYSDIPVVLVARHTNASLAVFSGCYTVRRTNDGISPDPNAVLWRIYKGVLQPAPANADLAALLAQGCPH